jgi:hypothetical protein
MELEQSWDKSQFHPKPVPSRLDRHGLSDGTVWDTNGIDWDIRGTGWDNLQTVDFFSMKSSKLAPYQTLIASLRKEGKSYREIVQILNEAHGLTVGHNTLHSFVKVRSKRPRKVYTMLENIAATAGTPREPQKGLAPNAPSRNPLPGGLSQPQASAATRASSKEGPFLKTFTPGNEYNLTRLSAEEKAAFERELEREIELERQPAKSQKGD